MPVSRSELWTFQIGDAAGQSATRKVSPQLFHRAIKIDEGSESKGALATKSLALTRIRYKNSHKQFIRARTIRDRLICVESNIEAGNTSRSLQNYMTQGINESDILLRRPTADDAAGLHRLVAECPPLDPNSLYCNLLHCTHFSASSVAATVRKPDGSERLVGFISAYVPPGQPDTLFVWQVAVAAEARGIGLARRMLDSILERPNLTEIRFVDTTITPGNQASWALFESWARRHGAPTNSRVHFERERHFGGLHEEEHLMRIGPFEIAAETAT